MFEKKNFIKIISLLILIAYFTPFLKGGDTEVRVHDQLDSFNVFDVLINSGKMFKTGVDVKIDSIMNGLPRSNFPSKYYVVEWMFLIFGHLYGFIINYIIVHCIGFLGMLLLLRNYVFKGDDKDYSWLIALVFATLPVFTLNGISVMGMPLVYYALLNIKNNYKIILSLLLISLYVVYSSLIHAGVFLVLSVGIGFIYFTVRERKINFKVFFSIVFLVSLYALLSYDLIHSILFSGGSYVSHRVEFTHRNNLNLMGLIGMTITASLDGNYTSANYLGLPIVILSIVAIVFLYIKKYDYKPILYLLIALLCFGFMVTIWDWKAMDYVYDKTKLMFVSFNPRRFYFLLPITALLLLSFSIKAFSTNLKRFYIVAYIFIASQVGYNFFKTAEFDDCGMTFNEYFSFPLLTDMDNYIDKPKESYRIIHLGLPPTISQCYGFYTLDSYQNNYPLSYKKQFRKLMEKELDKSLPDKKRFDNTSDANRCYLFAKIEKGNGGEQIVKQFDFNTDDFKKMGGKFLFSAARIENASNINLLFLKKFTHPDSQYIIYLYEAI